MTLGATGNSMAVGSNPNGANVAYQINSELGVTLTTTMAVDNYDPRALAQKYGSGTTIAWLDFYNKTLPTYSIAASTTSVNEPGTVTFTITTTNIPNGTVLYYSISGTVVAADFSDATLTGSFTISGNAGSISKTTVADTTTEGNETFTLSIRTSSTAGTIRATSATITVNDTSLTPPPPPGSVIYSAPPGSFWPSPSYPASTVSYTWTCPPGITSAGVLCIGAGGGGMCNFPLPVGSGVAKGGAGGGGGLAYANVTVVGGTNYPISVGVGGSYFNGPIGIAPPGGTSTALGLNATGGTGGKGSNYT
jgi:hypothetical protein